jgi:hypothetical protein
MQQPSPGKYSLGVHHTEMGVIHHRETDAAQTYRRMERSGWGGAAGEKKEGRSV